MDCGPWEESEWGPSHQSRSECRGYGDLLTRCISRKRLRVWRARIPSGHLCGGRLGWCARWWCLTISECSTPGMQRLVSEVDAVGREAFRGGGWVTVTGTVPRGWDWRACRGIEKNRSGLGWRGGAFTAFMDHLYLEKPRWIFYRLEFPLLQNVNYSTCKVCFNVK